MKVTQVGSRGTMLTFEGSECPVGGMSLYLINGENRVYLCDTHLGNESMELVKQYLADSGMDHKDLVVFLSHHHWDHVWGNGAFPRAMIVGHEKCKQLMLELGPTQLKQFSEYMTGEVALVPPTLTFETRMVFEDDGVEFFYTSGHTIDSAVCYDRLDSVLFIGDVVEDPEPVICHHDLETYIESLEDIKAHPAKTLVTSHSGIVAKDMVEDNIRYVRKFHEMATTDPGPDVMTGDEEYEASGEAMARKLYVLLMYEEAARETMKDDFDYAAFQREVWSSLDMDYLNGRTTLLRNTTYDDLELALQTFMSKL